MNHEWQVQIKTTYFKQVWIVHIHTSLHVIACHYMSLLYVISLHVIFITPRVPTAANCASLTIVFIPCTSKCVCAFLEFPTKQL